MARKKARSTSLFASMLWIRSPLAASANVPTLTRKTAAPMLQARPGAKSRNDFNVHPLRTHVVSDVFRSDCQMIGSGNHLFRNEQFTCVRIGFRIPMQTHRRSALEPRDKGA